jgi:hypothetical protein
MIINHVLHASREVFWGSAVINNLSVKLEGFRVRFYNHSYIIL